MSPLLTRIPGPLRRLFWSAYGRSVWDAEHDERANPLVRQVMETVMANGGNPGAQVLDVGCGTGVYARALAETGYHVTAIDTASGMLLHARQRAKTLPRECPGSLTVEAVSVDTPLPFREASFDVVLLVSVLQAVPQPAFALREIHRVLVPGGILCIVHFLPHPNKALPLRAELQARAVTLRSTGRAMRLWQFVLIALKSSVERQHVTHQWTPQELTELLTSTGYAPRVEQAHSPVIVTGRKETIASTSPCSINIL